MSYAAAVDHLYALGQELAAPSAGGPRRKFDLAHMRTLAEALGEPQRRFQSVLIAGTNGKGSTAATLASILATAGYRTGLYTSPHLTRVNERIQLSSPDAPTEYASASAPTSAGPSHLLPISDDDFARLYFRVDNVAQELLGAGKLPFAPSFFEVLTAVAFAYFSEQAVDIAVLEVGLGGRLDATNIVDPLLSIITDISLDHMEYLGSTITEIAREKAGILRPGGTLVTLPQHPEANQVFGEVAASLPGLRAVSAAEFVPPMDPRLSSRGRTSADTAGETYTVTFDGEDLLVESPLHGQHQQRNIALAIRAAMELRNSHGYKIPVSAIEAGIRHTAWPGRLEFVRPNLLLDVAHNPAGAWTLRAAISALPSEQPRTLIFSCLRDKNLREIAQILFPLFDSSTPERSQDHLIFAPIASPRAIPVEDLMSAARQMDVPAHLAPTAHAALQQARSVTPAGGLIVATGSVYLIGELRRFALETE